VERWWEVAHLSTSCSSDAWRHFGHFSSNIPDDGPMFAFERGGRYRLFCYGYSSHLMLCSVTVEVVMLTKATPRSEFNDCYKRLAKQATHIGRYGPNDAKEIKLLYVTVKSALSERHHLPADGYILTTLSSRNELLRVRHFWQQCKSCTITTN
jgi:hypothetical protein